MLGERGLSSLKCDAFTDCNYNGRCNPNPTNFYDLCLCDEEWAGADCGIKI